METMQLLLVDDEQDFLTYTSRRFKRRNVKISTAQSGQEALDLFEETEFDVVVLDVKMPGMDGMTVLERIRKIAPRAKVILLTGHASTEAAVQGMALGAFEYMLKPVQFEELYFKVIEAARAARATV
ncbi:response regulator [Desulfovibrio ferrophilus]|uniref:Response regulator receiver protein n=1 Tax=Desulfovibrio ferrophilus TaxID=241368 RepID=A0A2Z6AY23_9BACT|nr:response regulator receiver protein [Desulfovibrio ferrophilus]